MTAIAPPQRAYHKFVILFSDLPGEPNRYTARIAGPLLNGQLAATEQETLSYDPQRFMVDDGGIAVDLLEKLSARTIERSQLFQLGKLLSDIFLPGSIRRRLREDLIVARERGLSIRLHLDIRANVLRGLPCEYLYLPAGGMPEANELDFLALDSMFSIVRDLGIDAAEAAPRPQERYRMVAAFASPPQQPALNLAADRAALERMTHLEGAGHFDMEYLPKATLDDLLAAFRSPADVFHFSGHGTFDGDKGQIILEGSADGNYYDAELLANLLRAARVRLAVLSACQTGQLSGENVWGAVVTELQRAGVAAVVASQFRLRDENANVLTATLYRELLAGATVDEALYHTRQAIYQKSGGADRDWGALVLYARLGTAAIFPSHGTAVAVAQPRVEPSPALRASPPAAASAVERTARASHAHPVAPAPDAGLPAGKLLTAASVRRLKTVAVLAEHADQVLSLAFSRDGKLLATGSGDARVRLWDTTTGKLLRTLTDHKAAVNSVAFSPHGLPLLASGSSDESICVWDISTYERLYQWKGQFGGAKSLAFSPDGSLLVTALGTPASHASALWWWDVVKGKAAYHHAILDGHVYSIAFRPADPPSPPQPPTVALGLGNLLNRIELFSTEKYDPLEILSGHEEAVRCIAFSPDGKILASASADKTIRFWDFGVSGKTKIWTGLLPATVVAFSSDGDLLAAVRGNNMVVVTTAVDPKALCVLDKHEHEVTAVAFSPDGRTMATSSLDRTARLWRVP